MRWGGGLAPLPLVNVLIVVLSSRNSSDLTSFSLSASSSSCFVAWRRWIADLSTKQQHPTSSGLMVLRYSHPHYALPPVQSTGVLQVSPPPQRDSNYQTFLADVDHIPTSGLRFLCVFSGGIKPLLLPLVNTHFPIPSLQVAPSRLIGGNPFALWSAVMSAVMTRAGRCYRSRFGGAILLTRSLLRQAVSNNARRRVNSSKACPCQTVGDLHFIFFFTVIGYEWHWSKTRVFRWE